MRTFIGALLACWSLSGVAGQPAPNDAAALKAQLQGYYFDAARRGDLPMLDTFIDAGFPLNTQDDKGYTALILAAYHGESAYVERLLAAGFSKVVPWFQCLNFASLIALP